ncbi:MAG: efflux RND transporter permease subunit, partial [Ignavibacteriae bacterium]
TNLIEGALIVIFVLVLMLGNARAGLIVARVIPLSMLFALGMMDLFDVSGNLMSLGAIDFGLIVDGAVIVVEDVLHKLQGKGERAKGRNGERDMSSRASARDRTIVRDAAIEIRRSAAFGEFIILIVYLPILTMVNIEGKLFGTMAQTVVFAIMGAFILSTTYVPMMASLFLRAQTTHKVTFADRIMSFISKMYVPVRNAALRNVKTLIIAASILFTLSLFSFLQLGGEFIPTLDEGDFAVETRLITGSSLTETIKTTQQAAAILKKEFPEVISVVGKIGTTEIPMDPMPIESGDLMVILKDKKEWTSASTREELASKMQASLEVLPGVAFGFQQPIQMRFNELMTGARQDVVIKVFGDDLDTLVHLVGQIGSIARSVQGASDIYEEPVSGLPQIVVRANRQACALLGVNIDDVNATIRSAFAGEYAGSMYEQERRFDVVVRLRAEDRTSITDLERLTVPTRQGTLIPLQQVAEIRMEEGPNQIQREGGRRRIIAGFNVRDRDIQSVVDEIRARIDADVSLPAGYDITYGGAFENLNAAKARLSIAVPAALLLIVVLLYLTFGTFKETILVFTAIPLSAIGGIAALMLRGMPFSISAGVGFIALFGVAVLNGIVLMAAFKKHEDLGPLRTVLRGTSDRLRPVAMTALVASLGFLPMAISNGDGAEVQRPLA